MNSFFRLGGVAASIILIVLLTGIGFLVLTLGLAKREGGALP